MRFLVRPSILVSAAVAAAGAILSNAMLLAAGIVGVAFSVMLTAMREVRSRREELGLDSLPPEERTRLAPVRRLRGELEELVASNKGSAALAVIGPEAVREASHIFDQCVRLLGLRHGIRKSLRDEGVAVKEIATLERRLAETRDQTEGASLEAALSARRLEVAHYAKMREALATVEGGVVRAEAALSEIKARLSIAATEDSIGDAGGEELRETLGRMKALSAGFEEAEAFLKGRME